MTQNSASFEQQLNSFGISLHQAIINQLIGEIESAISNGAIRSNDGRHSVYDFIREILGKKSAIQVWSRLSVSLSKDILILYEGKSYLQGNRRRQTPTTNMLGLLIIAHALGYGQSARKERGSAELSVKEALAKKLKGEIEVLTPVGSIDILTSQELIEVKQAALWKTALGQVMAYGYFYPIHVKRIHLFGACHSESRCHIKAICEQSSVQVTWDSLTHREAKVTLHETPKFVAVAPI